MICVHQEACTHLDRTIHQIKEAGLKAGVALNPATPISVLENILELPDMFLMMSVNPGFGGQKLIPYVLEKIRSLRKILNERGLDKDIEIDGGVTLENIRQILDAGANVIVAGSSVFQGSVLENTRAFMEILG